MLVVRNIRQRTSTTAVARRSATTIGTPRFLFGLGSGGNAFRTIPYVVAFTRPV